MSGNLLISPPSRGEEEDPFIVDFSLERKAQEKIRGRASQTEYDNVDLSSGYPKHMIWVTKDKRRIAIPNLEDSHLLNIIAYLRRREEDYKMMHIAQLVKGIVELNALAMMFDEIPYYEEKEIHRLVAQAKEQGREIYNLPKEAWLRKYNRCYPHLLKECYKRKLLIEVDSSKIGT